MIRKYLPRFLLFIVVLAGLNQLGYFFTQSASLVELISQSVSIKELENNRVATKNDHNSQKDVGKVDNWWEAFVETVSVSYQPSNNTDWCQNVQEPAVSPRVPAHLRHTTMEQNFPKTGIYLVKTKKAGSSTAAAVTLQIAESIAKQKGYSSACPHHAHHGQAFLSRQEPYFMWTILREPAKRSISEYFFKTISRRNLPYDDSTFIQALQERRNFQLNYVRLQNEKISQTNFDFENATQMQVIQMVTDILNTYQFVAITERMDESLVVMKLLYGFPDEAMVVLSSKKAGGFDGGAFQGLCHRIQKAYTTPKVDDYLAGGDFQKGNYDYFLYAAANRSLDMVIDMLGREVVAREVKRHQELARLAEEHCLKEAVFPCTRDGVPPDEASYQSCYFQDVGCGHECVMRVLSQRKVP